MIPVMERKVYNCCRHTTMTGEESHRTVSMFQGSSAMSRWHHSIDEKTLEISKYPRCIILFEYSKFPRIYQCFPRRIKRKKKKEIVWN
ncbi:hypothetical protein ANTQUA_LOCUS2555 [Anthophora quadrimaculata]